ncbi:MAG: DUF2828 family protein [Clostridia bacterium]|nr:DUF2828 family protein [Clostridia bacterium]
MSFIDELKRTLEEDFNLSVTENGALGYRTTCNALLDMNFAVSSFRNCTEENVKRYFVKAFYENKLLAVLWLFFAGDVRGGLGERRLFKIGMKFLAESEPKIAERLLPLVAEYTRWDNLLPLLETGLKDAVCALLKKQLDADVKDMKNGRSISLCAKWMPSANATSLKTKAYAKMLIKAWGITEKEYRKTLASLRAYSDVIEVKMSKKAWGEINYETVPSRANLLYANSFLRNDKARRDQFLKKLEQGEAKINAGVLFPHDIVNKYIGRDSFWPDLCPYDETLEALWKALPDYVQGQSDTICVADGSGSMTSRVGQTNISALDVANALAVYFSERSSGPFKDRYITFSRNPQFVDFSHCKSLHDKLGVALSHDEAEDTNIEAVFNLILKTAINGKMSQSDLPRNILILSDMEFNACAVSSRFGNDVNTPQFKRLFEVIGERYEKHGYKLPRLVFWNICSRSNTVPLKENKLGVALVSGFSPIVVNMVLSGKIDPLECLLEQLASERYAPVLESVRDLV